ncbi:MAG: HD domain-containing protein [Saprospiraceae bacterium]
MKQPVAEWIDLEAHLRPETDLERQLLQDPEFLQGLLWGVPRYGHPEGEVYKHIREVLDNIDRLDVDLLMRNRLRIIAFAHDTFKYLEDKSIPRDWLKHHGPLARRFMERFTTDEAILDTIELHDEAYHCWRIKHLHQDPDSSRLRLQGLLDRIGEHRQLYYLFFKCDTKTGDKNPAPLNWFEQNIPEIEIVAI